MLYLVKCYCIQLLIQILILSTVLHIFLSFTGPSYGVRVIKSSLQLSGHDEDKTHRAFFVVGSIFVTSLVALCYIYVKFPELEP